MGGRVHRDIERILAAFRNEGSRASPGQERRPLAADVEDPGTGNQKQAGKQDSEDKHPVNRPESTASGHGGKYNATTSRAAAWTFPGPRQGDAIPDLREIYGVNCTVPFKGLGLGVTVALEDEPVKVQVTVPEFVLLAELLISKVTLQVPALMLILQLPDAGAAP